MTPSSYNAKLGNPKGFRVQGLGYPETAKALPPGKEDRERIGWTSYIGSQAEGDNPPLG